MLQERQVAAVGVVDGSERLTGLITPETIGEMLLASAMPEGRALRPPKSGSLKNSGGATS